MPTRKEFIQIFNQIENFGQPKKTTKLILETGFSLYKKLGYVITENWSVYRVGIAFA
jgi:hypothetical protein